MKSPINNEKSLMKAKINEKTEINHSFQANEVNHYSLNKEMKWLLPAF